MLDRGSLSFSQMGRLLAMEARSVPLDRIGGHASSEDRPFWAVRSDRPDLADVRVLS